MSWGSLTRSEVDIAEKRLRVRLAGEKERKSRSRKDSQLHPVPGKHFKSSHSHPSGVSCFPIAIRVGKGFGFETTT
jgi:hypothetical protein